MKTRTVLTRNALAITAVLSCTHNLMAVLTPPATVPSTQASATAECTSEAGPITDTGLNSVFASQLGLSNSGEASGAFASATVSFFSSSLNLSGGIGVAPGLAEPSGSPSHATGAYELSWANGALTGDILGPFTGAFASGKQVATFSFIYGETYTITSLLTGDIDAVYLTAATAHGEALWSDTFKFLGQPDGTSGTATFAVDLSGVFFAETAADRFHSSTASAQESANLSVGDLPPGSFIVTGSGATVPSLPDAGSTLVLAGIAVSALVAKKTGNRV